VRVAAIHIACQKPGGEIVLPATPGETASTARSLVVPVSRFSAATIATLLIQLGMVAAMSTRTIARWLHADKLKPWRVRSWITPKDLATFLERACPVLDLYERVATGTLEPGEVVFSIDEKTSIQARAHASYTPTGAGEPAHLEHTYKRRGAVHLIAALNVETGTVGGTVVADKRFVEFGAFLRDLLTTVLRQGGRRIHLILDNGSTHRPKYLAQWVSESFPGVAIELHWLPVRSSWLNQVEIFFGILQQHALTPNDFPGTDAVTQRILAFIAYRNQSARPIAWTYTSRQLRAKHERLQLAA
jgi:hypothetical protein